MKTKPYHISVFQLYNDQILNMRKEGKTLQEIGDTVGVTRERVRQILKARWPEKGHIKIPTTTTCAKMLGTSPPRFEKIAKEMGYVFKQFYVYHIWTPEALEAVKTYLRDRKCRICGKNLYLNERVYCSMKCLIESRAYRNRPEAVKKRHKLQVKKWKLAHPERVREMSRRASRAYQQRKRLTFRYEVLRSQYIPTRSIVSLDPNKKVHGWTMSVIWEGKSYKVGKRHVRKVQ